jgi:hypothetical protein
VHSVAHYPGELQLVVHVRTGDVCYHCVQGGRPDVPYYQRILDSVDGALAGLGVRLNITFESTIPGRPAEMLRQDLAPLYPLARFLSSPLLQTVCSFLTADLLVATGSSLPVFVAAFAPQWRPILLEDRRKEVLPNIQKSVRNKSSVPAHFFPSDRAVHLEDGMLRATAAELRQLVTEGRLSAVPPK